MNKHNKKASDKAGENNVKVTKTDSRETERSSSL